MVMKAPAHNTMYTLLLHFVLLLQLCNTFPTDSPESTANDDTRSAAAPKDPATGTSTTTLPYLTSAIQCNSEQSLYWEARRAWSSQHATVIQSLTTDTETDVSGYSVETITSGLPTVTLCDGVPRAGSLSERTSAQTTILGPSVVTLHSTIFSQSYSRPPPSCYINDEDCSSLQSYLIFHSTIFPETWDIPCWTRPCAQCVLQAKEVKLYHWALTPSVTCTKTPPGLLSITKPSATPPPSLTSRPRPSLVEFTTPPHTVVSNGKTFASPYLYLSFHSIIASDYYNRIRCGGQPAGAAAMVSINSHNLRSVRHGWNGAAHSFDPNDYAYTGTLGTAIPLVPADAYNGMYRCWDGQAMTALDGSCATIRDDYKANIAWPLEGDQVFKLDPAWENCGVDSYMGLFVEGAEEIGKGPKETSAEVTSAPQMMLSSVNYKKNMRASGLGSM